MLFVFVKRKVLSWHFHTYTMCRHNLKGFACSLLPSCCVLPLPFRFRPEDQTCAHIWPWACPDTCWIYFCCELIWPSWCCHHPHPRGEYQLGAFVQVYTADLSQLFTWTCERCCDLTEVSNICHYHKTLYDLTNVFQIHIWLGVKS
jgi:hypothetical protein